VEVLLAGEFPGWEVVFVRGDSALEFGVIARAIDVMRGSGITTVGLMTRELENAR
jgi:biopolymer transport protein ExbD